MLILIDNPEHRAELMSQVRARIDCEIEEVSEALCEGRPATRSLRSLETLTKILAALEEVQSKPPQLAASFISNRRLLALWNPANRSEQFPHRGDERGSDFSAHRLPGLSHFGSRERDSCLSLHRLAWPADEADWHRGRRLRQFAEIFRKLGTPALGTKFALLLFLGGGLQERNPMATQIVMNDTGDTRHQFDPTDLKELAEAERRFKELTGEGFTAAARTGPGEAKIVRSFDPTAEETLFYPRLVGG
jgi:hypothetical protein